MGMAEREDDLMAVANARRLTGTRKPSDFDGGVQLEKIFFERTNLKCL
jgi:hypothetical protein